MRSLAIDLFEYPDEMELGEIGLIRNVTGIDRTGKMPVNESLA
jgi:hypothetical protein